MVSAVGSHRLEKKSEEIGYTLLWKRQRKKHAWSLTRVCFSISHLSCGFPVKLKERKWITTPKRQIILTRYQWAPFSWVFGAWPRRIIHSAAFDQRNRPAPPGHPLASWKPHSNSRSEQNVPPPKTARLPGSSCQLAAKAVRMWFKRSVCERKRKNERRVLSLLHERIKSLWGKVPSCLVIARPDAPEP